MERRGEIPRVTHDDGTLESDESLLRHRKRYSIKAVGRGSKCTAETDTGHVLKTDVPKKMGGDDSAPQPVGHLLTALVGCSQATAIFVGRSMIPRLSIDRIEFDLDAYRDDRGAVRFPIDVAPDVPSRLRRVFGTAKVFSADGASIRDDRLKILREQTEARCPVGNMMTASGCAVDIDWVDGWAGAGTGTGTVGRS